MVRASSKSKK